MLLNVLTERDSKLLCTRIMCHISETRSLRYESDADIRKRL